MALSIKLSTFVDAGYTGQLMRWILTETGSGAQIDTHEEAGPHGQVYNFSFVNNIRDIVYTISLYAIPGGGGIGSLIKAHDVTVSTSTIIFDIDIEIIVGHGQPQDPAPDAFTTPAIARLIGREWKVWHRSRGQLLIDREPEYSRDTVLGTFTLLGGQQFDVDDIYIVKFEIMYVVNPTGSVGGGGYTGVELVTVDRLLVAGDFGKLLIINQELPVITLTLPPKADCPEKIPLFFQNMGNAGLSINVIIKADGAETVMQSGFNDGQFILSRAQDARLIKLGVQFYGINASDEASRRGQVDFIPCPMINRLIADGSEYDADTLPGLLQSLSRFAVPSIKGSFVDWNAGIDELLYILTSQSGDILGPVRNVKRNQTHYAIFMQGGVQKIRVPNLQGKFIRGMYPGGDADRAFNTPFGHQSQAVPEHKIVPKLGERGGVDNNASGGGFGYENNNPRSIPSYSVRIGGSDNNNRLDLRPDNVGMIAAIII